jgi:REP element-mobilizing transposase RayT
MHRFDPRHRPKHFVVHRSPIFLTWRLHLSQPPLRHDERQLVMDVIERDDERSCRILAAVVMDDHVHALVALATGVTIQGITQTWKSVSSHTMTRSHGRIAPVWPRNYWDRELAAEGAIRRCIKYIATNPERRWPGIGPYPWVLPCASDLQGGGPDP